MNDFVKEFVEAAKEGDDKKMTELSIGVADYSVQDKMDLLQQIISELKDTKLDNKDQDDGVRQVEEGLVGTLKLMQLAVEAQATAEGEENSTGEEAKDEKSEAEEVTQDVAADTSAEEAVERDADKGEKAAESEGNAPAEEEEEGKSEEK